MQTPADIKIAKQAVRAARLELTRRHTLEFTAYTFPRYRVSAHNRLLCHYLDQWVSGHIDRLMVFMPPRHGKSELVSRRLPAYLLGRFPGAQILAVSYGQSLAESMSREARAVLQTEAFREIFPGIEISRERSAVSEWKTSAGGVYKCAGVGTGITGRGFDFGIIDDPVKDRREAESEAVRQSTWDWYTSTFYTRQHKGARILVTQTRWHEDDLAGRLLTAEKHDPRADAWTVLSLPALAEEPDALNRDRGQALWADEFSEEKLKKIRANIGTYDWEALYQQRPSPPGGSKIKPHWFKAVDSAPAGLTWVRYWDLAVSTRNTADYTASCALAVSREGDVYIRDMLRGRWIWPETRKIMIMTARAENIPIGIEASGQQQGFVDELVRDPDMTAYAVRGVRPDADKLTRALPWIARAESGQVYLVSGGWIGEFLSECQRFTGRDDRHDDQIDAVSGAYHMAARVKPQMFWV